MSKQKRGRTRPRFVFVRRPPVLDFVEWELLESIVQHYLLMIMFTGSRLAVTVKYQVLLEKISRLAQDALDREGQD